MTGIVAGSITKIKKIFVSEEKKIREYKDYEQRARRLTMAVEDLVSRCEKLSGRQDTKSF